MKISDNAEEQQSNHQFSSLQSEVDTNQLPQSYRFSDARKGNNNL